MIYRRAGRRLPQPITAGERVCLDGRHHLAGNVVWTDGNFVRVVLDAGGIAQLGADRWQRLPPPTEKSP